jgi:hypothetical protein
MPSVYWCRVAGDGLTTRSAFRVIIPPGISYAPLMVSPLLGRALFVSPHDSIEAANVIRLLTASTYPALRELARNSAPTGAQRNAINAQLDGVGLQRVTAAMNWAQAIRAISIQVNPVADLDLTEAG